MNGQEPFAAVPGAETKEGWETRAEIPHTLLLRRDSSSGIAAGCAKSRLRAEGPRPPQHRALMPASSLLDGP